jgi:serine/threonine protein kinase
LTKVSADALIVEADIMRRLAHPRIVACFGMFEHDDNQCVVMELMDAGSLHDYVYKMPCPEGWRNRDEIALDICTGMAYLHRLNVIHRYLKPGNVCLDEFLRAKITDFGLSVVKNTAVSSIKATEMGTVQYMVGKNFTFRLPNALVWRQFFLQSRTYLHLR